MSPSTRLGDINIADHNQNPGFSTVWTNILSCMPEAEYLLKARGVEQDVTRDPESTVLFETEMVSPVRPPFPLALPFGVDCLQMLILLCCGVRL